MTIKTKIEILLKENQELKQKNIELSKTIEIAKKWMERQIKEEINKISWNIQDDFMEEIDEKTIIKKINDFFWDLIIMNLPKEIIEHIISAEINYHFLEKNQEIDWLTIISSYQKIVDILVENYITSEFRKFAKKRWKIYLRKNYLVEKYLDLAVNKWYSISIWKLFHILKTLKSENEIYDYLNCFKSFLEKYFYIKDIIWEQNFFKMLENIVSSEILWEKRHKWFISLEETKKARKILIWNFIDKNCIIYKLIEIQNITFN